MRWRERIAAARERGYFNEDDKRLFNRQRTCLVGECMSDVGVGYKAAYWLKFAAIPPYYPGGDGGPRHEALCRAIYDTNDFDYVEDCLDFFQDHAQALKRQM